MKISRRKGNEKSENDIDSVLSTHHWWSGQAKTSEQVLIDCLVNVKAWPGSGDQRNPFHSARHQSKFAGSISRGKKVKGNYLSYKVQTTTNTPQTSIKGAHDLQLYCGERWSWCKSSDFFSVGGSNFDYSLLNWLTISVLERSKAQLLYKCGSGFEMNDAEGEIDNNPGISSRLDVYHSPPPCRATRSNNIYYWMASPSYPFHPVRVVRICTYIA